MQKKPVEANVIPIARPHEEAVDPIAGGKKTKHKFKLVNFADLSEENKEIVRNTPPVNAVIIEHRNTDYVAGVASNIPFEDRVPDSNHTKYLPEDNSQWLGVILNSNGQVIYWVDFYSCTSFSGISAIEAGLNFLYQHNRLPKEALAHFNKYGFIINGKFKLSNRYTAIRSGTTRQGNSLQNVIDSARKTHGVLPWSMLPDPTKEYFADIKETDVDEFRWKAQDRYLDPKVITPEMDAVALETIKYILISYEWIVMPNGADGLDTEGKKQAILRHLRHAMLQFAKDGHAMDFYIAVNQQKFGIYDSYPPYKREKPWEYDAPWIMKIVVDNRDGFAPNEVAKAKFSVISTMKGRKLPYFQRVQKDQGGNGEVYRSYPDGSFKYKFAQGGPLFDDMATPESKGGTGIFTPIPESLWNEIKAAEIK